MNSPLGERLSTLLSRGSISELLPDNNGLLEAAEQAPCDDRGIERFRDLLEAETYVDISKLKREARHGIPAEVRPEVWKYMLGVLRPEKSDELSLQQRMQFEYSDRVSQIHDDDDVARRVRGEVRRLQQRQESRRPDGVDLLAPAKSRIDVGVYVRLISIYLSSSSGSTGYSPAMVALVSPFVQVNSGESDAYYCFHALMKRHEEMLHPDGLNKSMGNFLTLLRVLQPDLTEHLENEEVEPNSWVPSWLQTLLAGQLRMSCVQRLWDTYFALPKGLEMHIYVCLAIIDWLRDELLEQDGPDISGCLLNLPSLDMDQIITRASNIREDVQGRNLL